ncbi:hypothetical protein ACFTXM_23145 [Streptomyces sp. NPDC056930]|uniref:hypothetical protein n=1 Tax=Streptomyces sp. NPDC056930 TaxID=3345967 RepID=UPI00363F9F6D
MARIGAAVLLLAAVVLAVAVPGVGTWIAAAVLAGLASALGGLVTRGADRVLARGRDAIVASTPVAPIVVEATEPYGRNKHVGPIPAGREEQRNSPGWVTEGVATSVYLTIEATVERAVILTKLDVRVESQSPRPPDNLEDPPDSGLYPAPMAREEVRTFGVDLGEARPTPRPYEGVPSFPYTVSHLDPERFRVHAIMDRPGDITWRVEIHWRCNGQSGVVVADDEGRPFRFVRILPTR